MESSEEDANFFAKLRFKGDVFEGEYIPVSALPSVAAYQKTLTEMAIAIWREDNPDRVNLPKNFRKSFSLGLEGIGTGSKVARLPRIYDDGQAIFSDIEFEDIFLEAQERLAKIVSAANRNSPFEPLPSNVVRAFEAMRKPLDASESIEVIPTSEGKKRPENFLLSQSSVSKVVNFSSERKIDVIEGLGFIAGKNDNPPQIKILADCGQFYYQMEFSDLRDAVDFDLGRVVRFSIRAEIDNADRVTHVINGIAISSATQSSLSEKLHLRLSALEAADDPDFRFGKEVSLRARDLIDYLGRSKNSVSLFATEESGVIFEWKEEHCAISLEVVRDHYLFGVSDLNGTEFREKSFKIMKPTLLRAILRPRSFVHDEVF